MRSLFPIISRIPRILIGICLMTAPLGAAEPATYEFGNHQSGDFPEPGAAFSDSFGAIGQPTSNLVYIYGADLSESRGFVRPPASDASSGSAVRFGHSCAWHGDTLLVGAPGFTASGTPVGRVYCFTRAADDTWTPAGTLENPNPAHHGFGFRILLHGNSLFVASEGIGGRFHEFQHPAGSGTWSLVSSSDLPANPNAASSATDPAVLSCLVTDGTNLLAGIGRGENDRGLVILYRKSGGTWQEQQRLAGTAGTTERFGSALCFADGELLAGAPNAAGPGRVARFRLQHTGPLLALGELEIPGWLKGAGTAIAHHDGRIMIGAPASSFNPNRANQGALLIADRSGEGEDTGWEWTGCIADPSWDSETYGSRIFATTDRFVVELQGWGKVFRTLEPGPRLAYAYLPASYETDEDAAVVRLGIATSRPVNTVQILERGPLGGTATAGSDYVAPPGIDFLYPGTDWHELPVLITKDLIAEPTETIRMDEAKVWGADRFGDNPVISIADRAPRNGELPTQVIAHVTPPVADIRSQDFFPAPENISMSDEELILGYYVGWGHTRPRLLRFIRQADGQWVSAPEIVTPPSSVPGDRRVGAGALVHDETLILLGEDGDLYSRGHIRSFVKNGAGDWVPGAALWSTADPVGSFGSEIILTSDWVFANQGVSIQGHSGFIHAFRRQGGTLTLHSVLSHADAGFSGGDWGSSRATIGGQLAWSPPYLAASFTSPGANALQKRGVAIFRWNENAGKFEHLQNFAFDQVASTVQILEFSQGMLVAGHDNGRLRCYVPQPTGLFQEVPSLFPPAEIGIFQDWSVPSPTGFLVGMQESRDTATYAAVPQAVGYERLGNSLRPTLSYLPVHPWHTRGEIYSNVSPAGRFAVVHSDPDQWSRRDVMIVEMGRDLPRLTITPETNQVGSTRDSISFSASLDTPATTPLPLVVGIEGFNGGTENRDFVPHAQTRFLEAGESTANFTFRLLDNPHPVAGAAVRARPAVGFGLSNPDEPSPPVAYMKERTTLPRAIQRIIPDGDTSFAKVAFDGDDLLFRRYGGAGGHSTRTRTGGLFSVNDGPAFSEPGLFPRTDRNAHGLALHGDLVVLGNPGLPGQAREDAIQFGRKTGPGQWLLNEVIPGPAPFFASSLGDQTASNGRFVAIAQNKDSNLEPIGRNTLFHVFDISGQRPVMIGSVSTPVIMVGSSLIAIDQRDRLYYRDFKEQGACLSVAQLSSTGIIPLGTVNPRRDPRITWTNTFGTSIQCSGNFVIAGDFAAEVDGLSSGAVYIMEETAAGWETRQIIFSPDPVFIGSFGYHIVAERDWLAIGEPFSSHSGSIHLYRASEDGYTFVKSIHAFTPLTNLERTSALGGSLMLCKGILLAPALEQQPVGSGQAIYSIDLTGTESFAAWSSRMGMDAEGTPQDQDGDGLDLQMEWATGNDPDAHSTWWGHHGGELWFEVGTEYNASVRLIIERSTNLTPGSWTTVAVRDGLGDWTSSVGPELQLHHATTGRQRVMLTTGDERGFYRMRAEENNH
ncbi:hypothetical protein OKA04_08765 [Luteolibacter flavescens]|uniref:Uncharacterized protein n=1 Tax=Luteolibacter flavescens TaxID=1859460 RepID=A0ABT3FML7_9BACT|nr:hypothetical protein [Luteolibacter flavescens]MCW1884817.1 hypothetical protein [Luteolibacter flavescens]